MTAKTALDSPKGKHHFVVHPRNIGFYEMQIETQSRVIFTSKTYRRPIETLFLLFPNKRTKIIGIYLPSV